MTPIPMRPWQNALVIAASFLVAGSLWPWSSRFRLSCAAGAVAILCGVLIFRLRAHTGTAQRGDVDLTHARIERIRAARAERMGPRR